MKKLNLNKVPQWMALVVSLFTLSIGNAWGGDNYWYAHLTVTTNPESGAGFVYADRFKIDEEGATRTYEEDSFTGEGRATSSGGDATFHAYAKANRGYKFDHWKNVDDASERTDYIKVTRKVYEGNDGKDKSDKYTEYNDLVAYFVTNPSIDGGVTYKESTSGSYTVDYDLLNEDPTVPANNFKTYDSDVITLTATANSGYNFKGWKVNGEIVSYDNPWETSFEASAEVEPIFAEGAPNFKVGGVTFENLNEAIEFAQEEGHSPIVVVNQDYTISSGNYTIPSGVTLLVPSDDKNTCYKQLKIGNTYAPYASSWTEPTGAYRTLTLEDGVHIDVEGELSVSAIMNWAMGHNGSPSGKYGFLKMNNGSTMSLKSGSSLFAWGYIAGEGTITAEPGSHTYEGFQVTGYRGGNATSGMEKNRGKVFPMNQYYVQNIENRITFQAGALEHLFMGVTSSFGDEGASIDFIGGPNSTNTLFLLKNGATLTKWYDPSKDRQKFELNGNAELDQIVLDIASVSSKDYVLPLTNNMDLDIKSGITTINYDVAIFPDVNIRIREGAQVSIKKNVYMYDADEWNPAYAYAEYTNNDPNTQGAVTFKNVVRPIGYTTTTKFSRTSVEDANILVEGILSIEPGAKLFTTASGANIVGTEAGSIYLGSTNNDNGVTYQAVQATTGKGNWIDHYAEIPVTPAQLHNADNGAYQKTSGLDAGTTITYANGHWGWREIWKDGNTIVNNINTATKVNNASVQSWKEIDVPAGSIGTWETAINEAKQEVIHTALFESIPPTTDETLEILEDQAIIIAASEEEPQTFTNSGTVVNEGGKITIDANTTLSTPELVISASPENSGEIVPVQAPENSGKTDGAITATNVHFDLTRGEGKVFKHHTWYAFSVPFQVNAAEILFDGTKMQYNTESKKDDYDILYYDGSVRAKQGKAASCWKYVEKDAQIILHPGVLYMIANTRRDVTTLRFTKLEDADLLTTSVNTYEYTQTTGNDADANWNGMANPALFHADMSGIGAAAGQVYVYNPDYTDPTNAYVSLNLNDTKVILGEAFFAQVTDNREFTVSASTNPSLAPQRRAQARAKMRNSAEYYQVSVAQNGKPSTDEVIIRMTEDKEEDKYIIGQDLTRMGMSTINPQIWVDRYDEKLRVNTAAPVANEANYPLGIFAPAAGEYDITMDAQPNDGTVLYLTLNGELVWNLTEGGYTITLSEGNDYQYGLRVVSKAPQVATGVDEAIVDAKGETRKMLINGNVYIIRENHVYSVDGQLVK